MLSLYCFCLNKDTNCCKWWDSLNFTFWTACFWREWISLGSYGSLKTSTYAYFHILMIGFYRVALHDSKIEIIPFFFSVQSFPSYSKQSAFIQFLWPQLNTYIYCCVFFFILKMFPQQFVSFLLWKPFIVFCNIICPCVW